MNISQVKQIITQSAFPDEPGNIDLIETHISWIILSANFAFKIKKPVHFSFLDFSTLEKRKYYCLEELELNKRLTNDIYLEVLPITIEKNGLAQINTSDFLNKKQPMDYCVQMRRMNNDYRMDKLLKENQVDKKMMYQLADQLAKFHKNAKVLRGKVNAKILQKDFADILNFRSDIIEVLGEAAFSKIKNGVGLAHQLLNHLSDRISWREQKGWVRDGHGDLHSANIIIENEPIIFDCIEFNEHFRQQDLLNELAFLCMDLAYYNQEALSQHFLTKYLKTFNCMLTKEDHLLFLFYKCYRANIKVKVNIIKAIQQQNDQPAYHQRIKKANRYLQLFNQYTTTINSRDNILE